MSKRKKPGSSPAIDIDLHGMSLSEALAELDAQIGHFLRQRTGNVTVKIITGKGLHSGPDGSVLPREVHRHFVERFRRYILTIEDSPHTVTISGIPIRGHFSAKLKIPS